MPISFLQSCQSSLSADLLSCTGRRILLCGTNQPCIFHCRIRNANLRTWLSVFRDQYFRCRPDDGIRKRILLRTDHISSLVCTAAFVSDHSADEIWSDWHMAGCSRSRSNDPPCCCMVSEAGPKVIAVDSRGKSVKNRVQAENIKRQGTTAMVIPCLCSFLFESRTVHHKKIPRPFPHPGRHSYGLGTAH